MSPLDDELRAALSGRAQALRPAPDPLAGIERRAKQIRRTRIGAAVAGSALAVALVAAVVPAVQGATSSGPPRGQFAESATPTPQTSPYALDPENPWGLRGDGVDEGARVTIQNEYATRVQGEEVLVTPLFSQVYEPSQQLEVVFLAKVDGGYRWGVAQSSEAGPKFVWDEELPESALALAAALPGDEGVARLLVVASPEVSVTEYAPDATNDWRTMVTQDAGVTQTALEGDPGTDAYRVLVDGYRELVRADAPDPRNEQLPSETDADVASYGLDLSDPWEFRGAGDPADLAVEDERLFVQTRTPRAEQDWSTQPLYAASSDAGVEYLFVLHTAPGQDAVVTTTYRIDGGPARQLEQVVRDGQMLIQATLPTALPDGAVMHVALASPRAGGIVLEQGGRSQPDGIGDPGVGLWAMDAADQGTGRILLYTEGDGVEYHVEDVTTL